jgi:phospholipase D1/2
MAASQGNQPAVAPPPDEEHVVAFHFDEVPAPVPGSEPKVAAEGGKAIIVRPTESGKPEAFQVRFQGFDEGPVVVRISAKVSAGENFQAIGKFKGSITTIDSAKKLQALKDASFEKVKEQPADAKPPAGGKPPEQPKPGDEKAPSIAFSVGGNDARIDVELPSTRTNNFYGDWWDIKLSAFGADSPAAALLADSPIFPVAALHAAESNDPGLNATYNWYAGNDVKFYKDASDDEKGASGAFADIDVAIGQAKSFIFIADWSFHPYVRLRRGGSTETVGQKLLKLAKNNPNMLIAIHTWDHSSPKNEIPNDLGGWVLDLMAKDAIGKDGRPDNLLWRASSRSGEGGKRGFGWSHHQKFVVLDCEGPSGRREIRAFFGGLDLTKGRFDWTEHRILPKDQATDEFLKQIPAKSPGYSRVGFKTSLKSGSGDAKPDDWYNAEFKDNRGLPRQPWHDIYAQITGPTAWDFIHEFVGRWNRDPSTICESKGDTDAAAVKKVTDKLVELSDRKNYLQQWETRQGRWVGQVLRSITKDHWGPAEGSSDQRFAWRVLGDYEKSIQEAYIKAIRRAGQSIYIETQYLIGSGYAWRSKNTTLRWKEVANKIPEEIVNRIKAMADQGAKFHAYIIKPMYPEEAPTSFGIKAVRQLEWRTIDYMVSTLYEYKPKNQNQPLGDKWKNYLSFYFPIKWEGVGDPKKLVTKGSREERVLGNRRYMIYVHSKLMIVDDAYVILGSANLNERSLNGGRDSEICVQMSPGKGFENDCTADVRAFRKKLLDEHTGKAPDGWENPHEPNFVKSFQDLTVENWRIMRKGVTPSKNGNLCRWPIEWDPKNSQIVFNSAPYPNNVRNEEGMAADQGIPDWENENVQGKSPVGTEWDWLSPGSHKLNLSDMAE